MTSFSGSFLVIRVKKFIRRWFHFLVGYFTANTIPEPFRIKHTFVPLRTEEELYERVCQDLQKDFEMVCYDFRKAFEKAIAEVNSQKSEKPSEKKAM